MVEASFSYSFEVLLFVKELLLYPREMKLNKIIKMRYNIVLFFFSFLVS